MRQATGIDDQSRIAVQASTTACQLDLWVRIVAHRLTLITRIRYGQLERKPR